MMLCQVCHLPARRFLCERCRNGLRPAPERLLDGGIRVVAAFEHSGVARDLVLGLKYRGLTAFAELVAETLASRVPALPIVPVPRTWSRQMRYGVDPAREIAIRLAGRSRSRCWTCSRRQSIPDAGPAAIITGPHLGSGWERPRQADSCWWTTWSPREPPFARPCTAWVPGESRL